MMTNALIGCSGFVGSTLSRQVNFDHNFRSTNIGDIVGCSFDTVVCAAAPAQKWIANRDPSKDMAQIQSLIDRLKTIDCRRFILISTVDVFADPRGVDEGTEASETGLQPYGLHRLLLERFVQSRFQDHLVVRLPGLVGPGLRKNVIFDFLNHNNLESIESRGMFQFYPMVNLWSDLEIAAESGLSILHLTSEPISVRDVARHGFGIDFDLQGTGPVASYDMRTLHAPAFGGSGSYQYDRRAALLAIRAYAQSEPVTREASR